MQPNIGVGFLNIKGFHIDYTYTNLGKGTNQGVFYSHVISAHFGLQNFKKKNKKNEEEQIEQPLSN
ncbi:MAG: hypothetical protein R2836_00500 [Chitinophagales bacterium]